ncbi:MAG: hypothetical protein HY918_04105 [Candidatus Doudnabacteria bacterium]|nr:hypothetical protein [Candidatus Doudnabacteria bacterium]
MNLKSYFSTQNLLQINPVTPVDKIFLLGGVILLLLGIVLKISSVLAPTPADKKYRNKFYHLLLSIGLLEMFWYFCRYENVSLFGSYLLNWVIAIVGLVWLVVLLTSAMKNYKAEKAGWDKEQQKKKYLPS